MPRDAVQDRTATGPGGTARPAAPASSGLLHFISVGVILGAVALAITTSYVGLVFVGELEPYRPFGLSLALLGSAIFAVTGTFAGSLAPVWWGNQSPIVVLLSVGAASITATIGPDDPQALLATVLVFIFLSTFLSGAAFWLLGWFGHAQSAKFIPYPVVGGFLAATGILLIIRGAQLSLNEAAPLHVLLEPSNLALWGPSALAGIALAFLARRIGLYKALMVGMAGTIIAFYGWLALTDQSLAEAQARGLLFGSSPLPLYDFDPEMLSIFARVDPAAIVATLPTIAALVILSVLSVVMNVTGIEIERNVAFDLNHDMVRAGQANMLAAFLGAYTGFHSVSNSRAIQRLVVGQSRLLLLSGALVIALSITGALGFIAVLPIAIFAVILSLIGFDLVLRWLIDGARIMPRSDYAVMLGILATTLVFDFATAILVGIIAAALLFVFAYSRLKVVHSEVTASLRRSGTERPETDTRLLSREGRDIVIFELQNYLFFGSANALFDRVARALIHRPRPATHLLLDLRRTAGMDVSTAFVLVRLVNLAQARGVKVALSGLSEVTVDRLRAADLSPDAKLYPTLEAALAIAEEDLLAEHGTPQGSASSSALSSLLTLAEAEGIAVITERRVLAAGETLFAQGEPGDSLALVEQGVMTASIARADGSKAQIARFLPGAVVGEIAFSNAATRTASIVAMTPAKLAIVSRAALDAAATDHPAFVAAFHAELARSMADRLGRTTALLYTLDA